MPEFRAIYRLQLGPHLDFAGARGLVPYLAELGVSHLYLSPSLQARKGSTHGYDVADPTRVSADLGDEDGLRALADAAGEAGLGIVLDVVPNHMYAGDENAWWRDPELRSKFFDVDPETGRYRRFFDIDDLAGLRQEDPEVFEATHGKVLELVTDGVVDGLRIDHPDGMADPAGYLRRLAERGVEHVWVEKILEAGEALRDWPVEGTVGYEFCNDVQAVFVDPRGFDVLDGLWREIDPTPWDEVAHAAKLEQASTTFAYEVERLGELGSAEDLAAFPVYRTYVEPEGGRVDDADRAVVVASGVRPEVARTLLLEDAGHATFVTRFQQTTPPVMAKGVEDTAFYRYLRLLALNEVGGDPDRFGLTVEDFHAANLERARRHPRGLLTTQTHDTKRSGDTRARIGALAGMADAWRDAVARWRQLNAPLRHSGAPDAAEEYLIFQTLVGAWPLEVERLEEYLVKALREAKRNTSWVEQDHDWEGRVTAYARELYEHGPFRADFEEFAASVAQAARGSVLGQLLLKLTSPGVPDIYQGDELESLALVDPDNRRPVDWDRRRELLDQVRGGDRARPEIEKLWLIVRTLGVRAEHPVAFAGAYLPVDAGPDAVCFTRGDDAAIWVGVRLREAEPLPGPPEGYEDVLGGALGDGLALGVRR
ncbi:MAG TPA: malto-oligosyltrehalose synthase [Solirubrobacteraceae bacterium]